MALAVSPTMTGTIGCVPCGIRKPAVAIASRKYAAFSRSRRTGAGSSRSIRKASSDPAATAVKVGPSEPIELVALGHSREVHTLTITGTVRNPSSGVKLEGLTAVVSLLDRDGALVSTKDVPLDYRAIGPGEEAPFKVTIPDPGAIARYRVSFRAGTDVVPHVDRRVDTKLASALH